jgi:dTDP-glucose 4,6-dehydratase
MHLAALIGIPYSYSAPDNYVDTNVKGTLNVLQAARELGVQRVVHTSTSEVYGTAQSVPIAEGHRLHPQSPYAATKAAADLLALSFHSSFATPVVVVRPFNTYGPRQSARAVIPSIITQIAANARRVNLGSLHPTRDFCFVSDTVRAFAAAVDAPDVAGETINVATGEEISIADTAALIAELMNARIEIASDAQRVRPEASEVDRLWLRGGRWQGHRCSAPVRHARGCERRGTTGVRPGDPRAYGKSNPRARSDNERPEDADPSVRLTNGLDRAKRTTTSRAAHQHFHAGYRRRASDTRLTGK